jgi:hypothetical protein
MASGFESTILQSPPPKKSKAPWIVAGGCALLLLVVIVLGVGGYAFYRWRANTPGGTTTGKSQSTPGPGASPQNSNPNSNPAATTTPDTPSSWATKASTAPGETTTMTQTCSAGGTPYQVWGSDIYTADSSICTAAVHAGLINFQNGGTVTIELRLGRQLYGGSERHGVTTSVFGNFGRSFVFIGSVGKEADDVTPIFWETSASFLTYEVGKTYKFKCPAQGSQVTIWGTDIYTADSSICSAALHVGRINLESGGLVTIELRPGLKSYQGTLRNNLKSNDYGEYAHSFAVK